MRVLLISDHADPLTSVGSKEAGGQNIYVYYLARFLGRLGIFVDVYTRWDRKNKREVIHINSHIRVIRVKAGPKKYMPRDNFLSVVDDFAENVLKRIEQEKIRYDVIHANYWFSGLIGLKIKKILKVPLAYVYHSIGQIRYKVLKSYKDQKADSDFFYRRAEGERLIAHKADWIISTSSVEKKLIQKLFEIPAEKIRVITIGVDTKIFRPVRISKKRMRSKIGNFTHVILYVGRIEWRKGIGTLLWSFREVVKEYPGAKLYIVGGGNSKAARQLEETEYNRLRSIVEELGLEDKVVFLGAKKQKYLRRYYSTADVCAVPSYYEPFGIVPLEAMACGTPVVASKTGGLQYTVKHGKTGYLAKPRDYHDLAEKIKQVLKNGKPFYKDQCLARIHKHFEWEGIADQYQQFFNQFVNVYEYENSRVVSF
jgi:D-inositol-3-phosphate glycosyltransferase